MSRGREADEPGAFAHLSTAGEARMVDVTAKPATRRSASAEAWVGVGEVVARKLRECGSVAKGNVLGTARVAGIMAAKRTADLIPMCHPLVLDAVDLEVRLVGDRVQVRSRVTCDGKTGVEMEALTAVTVAALTVYDMCKSADKGITIGPIRLLEKSGGKSGHWRRQEER